MKYKGIILSLAVIAPLQQINAETTEDVAVLNEKMAKMQQQIDFLTANQKLSSTNATESKAINVNNEKSTVIGQTKLKFYGNIRVDAAYDFKGSTHSIANKTGSVPLNEGTVANRLT
ncbi:DcaP family trimeric outer membrane transporter [Acinetobacter baumannii]|uniref:DcaP family trimeric outer membrane transporter n=1 Tax=Acinetobacter baumannii TaxID=470 RepID=UPI0038B66D97